MLDNVAPTPAGVTMQYRQAARKAEGHREESQEASDEDVQRKDSVGNGVVDDIRTVLALGAGVADQLSLPLLHHRLITRHRRPSRDVARAHLLQKAFDAREQLSSILAVVGNGVEI